MGKYTRAKARANRWSKEVNDKYTFPKKERKHLPKDNTLQDHRIGRDDTLEEYTHRI